MKLISQLVLSFAAIAITACSSDAIEARHNEAEVMYRVPSYPPPSYPTRYADDNDRVAYVQPSYRAIPSECDELINSGSGYYYCDRD